MNKREEKIRQEVNRTLEMFEEAKHLTVNPDFYKQLRYKMVSRENQFRSKLKNVKLLLQPAALTFIVALNIYAGMLAFTAPTQEAVSRTDQLSSLVQEYHLDASNSDWLTLADKGE